MILLYHVFDAQLHQRIVHFKYILNSSPFRNLIKEERKMVIALETNLTFTCAKKLHFEKIQAFLFILKYCINAEFKLGTLYNGFALCIIKLDWWLSQRISEQVMIPMLYSSS